MHPLLPLRFRLFGLKPALIGIAILLAMLVPGLTRADLVVYSENYDSYAAGDWPAGYYQFGHNYEYYPNTTHVVAGVTPSPPSSPNCLMVTNPYAGWGGDTWVNFDWDPAGYRELILDADLMFPSVTLTSDGNDVRIRLQTSTGANGIQMGLLPVGGVCHAWAKNGENWVDFGEAAFGQWIHFTAKVDLVDATYDVYVNGVQRATDYDVGDGVDPRQLSRVFFSKGFWDKFPGYYDNVMVTADVPEPSMLVLLGIGAVSAIACTGRRRK